MIPAPTAYGPVAESVYPIRTALAWPQALPGNPPNAAVAPTVALRKLRRFMVMVAPRLTRRPSGGAERVHGGHQRRSPAEEIRHLDGFLDLGFRRAGGAGAVGDVGHAVRMRLESVHNPRHQVLVLRGNGPVAQDPLALGHVGIDEIRITLLQRFDPRWQRRLSHRNLLWVNEARHGFAGACRTLGAWGHVWAPMLTDARRRYTGRDGLTTTGTPARVCATSQSGRRSHGQTGRQGRADQRRRARARSRRGAVVRPGGRRRRLR